LLFAAFWGGVIAIAGVAFHQGNPAVLLYGLDYDGNVCGKKQPGANLLPYREQYFLNPNEARGEPTALFEQPHSSDAAAN
jgi:choline transporter-like protein 2/4/5